MGGGGGKKNYALKERCLVTIADNLMRHEILTVDKEIPDLIFCHFNNVRFSDKRQNRIWL